MSSAKWGWAHLAPPSAAPNKLSPGGTVLPRGVGAVGPATRGGWAPQSTHQRGAPRPHPQRPSRCGKHGLTSSKSGGWNGLWDRLWTWGTSSRWFHKAVSSDCAGPVACSYPAKQVGGRHLGLTPLVTRPHGMHSLEQFFSHLGFCVCRRRAVSA